MTTRRSTANADQAEMPFHVTLPAPAPGTVCIMRIEDFREFGVPGVAEKPTTERPTAKDASLRAWLFGQAAADRYPEGVTRSATGLVLSTTTEAAAAAFDPERSMAEQSRRISVGKALHRLGWRWRYLTVDGGKRERVFFAPDDWDTE